MKLNMATEKEAVDVISLARTHFASETLLAKRLWLNW